LLLMTIIQSIILISTICNQINSFSFPAGTTKSTTSYFKTKSSSNNKQLYETKFNDSFARREEQQEGNNSRDQIEEHDDSKIRKEEEDPETRALIEEIESVENKVAKLQTTQSNLRNQYEYYSKTGYLGKCSQIENARRSSSYLKDIYNSISYDHNAPSNNNNSLLAATARVIQYFIPAWEQLQNIQNKYSTNQFAKDTYFSLSLENTFFQQLGVTAFELQPGEKITTQNYKNRIKIISQENSNIFERDVIIRTEKSGLELRSDSGGNELFVLRLAECVISLGSSRPQQQQQQQRPNPFGQKTNPFGRRFDRRATRENDSNLNGPCE